MRAQEIDHTLYITLTGNPNVGKSTLFNALTGMHQHTGNWPGKTVGVARGETRRGNTRYILVDLPGTYSLTGNSPEEQEAGRYLKEHSSECTVVVCDGCCLERSLLLALQVLQRLERVVVCINLMDEAGRRGIRVDAQGLSRALGAPVVLCAAGRGEGLDVLLRTVKERALAPPNLKLPHWEDPIGTAHRLVKECAQKDRAPSDGFRQKIDRLLVSRRFGLPLMGLLFLFIVWLTVWGANYPAALLERLFDGAYGVLIRWLGSAPWWLRGVLADGLFATCARVICVMLPPMAIFFPLFTILEDMGYLPRMAFLMDPCMARCGGCGKQALTLCMGLGCNAVGVMGCRIIDSPRERLAAILTNAMVPCNGRFPTLIVLGSLFFPGAGAALLVAACVALGAAGAMGVSGLLNKTCLRGKNSLFILEIPPFRRPRLGKILVRSLLDRTFFVAGRAMVVAAPAGVILWLLTNTGLLPWLAGMLDPIGVLLGMNGIILLAFVFCLPANELLIPVMLMAMTGAGSLQAVSTVAPQELLAAHMDISTAVCTMVFTLFHWPCATTLMTIRRETGSIKMTAAACLLPTAVGCLLCIVLRFLLP